MPHPICQVTFHPAEPVQNELEAEATKKVIEAQAPTLPQVNQSVTPMVTKATANPPPNPSPAQLTLATNKIQDLSVQHLVAVVAKTTRTTIKVAKEQKKKAEKTPQNLGMCKASYECLLRMCGLSQGEDDEIPDVWWQISNKEMKLPMKKSIVKQWIKEHEHYQDAKVILYALLVNMILTRNFEEETSRSSIKSASKGLTQFAVPSLTDKQVDKINKHAEALEAATQTTVKDITATSMEAEGPTTFTHLTKLIRRFANLLGALFSSGCPLFNKLRGLLKRLDSYGNKAIQTMSIKTLTTIVWLVHLQARHFSAGKMDDGPTSIISSFSIMCVNVQTKQPVTYGNVPS